MKLLLYCTKAKPYLYHDEDYCFDTMNTIDLGYKTFEYTNQRVYDDETGKFLGWEKYGNMYKDNSLNGKIVAECDFEVEKIIPIDVSEDDYAYGLSSGKNLLKDSCLNIDDISEYLEDYNGETIFKKGYAIHIKNLTIFDEPKDLGDYHKIENVGGMLFTKLLTKAPKNIMRVSINHWYYATYNTDDIRILIPVSSQEMCRIANKEQNILIRKRVLKENNNDNDRMGKKRSRNCV